MEHNSHSIFDKEKGILQGCLKKGEDLISGLIDQCKYHGVQSGIITCMGSLSEVTFVHGVSDDNGEPTYSEEKKVKGAIELLSGTGVIARDDNGQIDIHFHGMVVNEDGTIVGGHFIKGKNPVLITIEFSIQTSQEIDAVRFYDKNLGFRVTNFSSKESV